MRVVRLSTGDWERARAVRLRALADAPDAFSTTFAEDEARPPEAWQARLGREDAATFVAMVDGRDCGVAFGAPYEPGAAGLFGMWVEPVSRGAGAAERLVREVIAWARDRGHTRLLLDVADQNGRALRLYERLGFAPTGVTGSLPPPRERVTEHQRVLLL